jgi:hypothetical protein
VVKNDGSVSGQRGVGCIVCGVTTYDFALCSDATWRPESISSGPTASKTFARMYKQAALFMQRHDSYEDQFALFRAVHDIQTHLKQLNID